MKTFLISLFTFAILTSGNNIPNQVKDIPSNQVLYHIVNSSVEIYSYGEKNGGCSGNLIAKNIVLTAKHCTHNSERIYVDNVKVKSIIISPSEDLALLILSKSLNKDIVKLSKENVNKKDLVFGLGKPFEEDYIIVGEYIKTDPELSWAYTKLKPGCSGAGVFNIKGELVGVWVRMNLKGTLGFFEPLDDIKEFIEDNIK